MHPNICKNCGSTFSGNYCNWWGQKYYIGSDKELRVICEEAFHFMTHFEGKFFKTLITVITRPGKLSADYCSGIRQRYYKPMSFFLLIIVLYLLFPYMEGLNMRLEYYKDVDLFGNYITGQIADKTIAMSLTEQQLGEIFRQKSEKTAKILLLLLIPLTALGLYLLNFRSKKTAYDYFILAIEINIFVILIFFLLLPLVITLILAVSGINHISEAILTPWYLAILLTVFTVMFRTFFRQSWLISFCKALLFMVLYYFITQTIYKPLLFEITFALI